MTGEEKRWSDLKEFTIENFTLDLQGVYKQNFGGEKCNFLLCGAKGSGKTKLASTAPKPVLFHSFDPGGTRHLYDQILSGEVLVDNRFEQEDNTNPRSYEKWAETYDKLEQNKVFEHMGTYVIDSITGWSEAGLAALCRQKGRKDGVAEIKDWQIILNRMRFIIRKMQSLPCCFIMTAHLEWEKDEVTGKMMPSIMISPKKAKIMIPHLFDEQYFCTVQQGARGPSWNVLTLPDGTYDAATRIGGGGIFEQVEEPDLTALLKKAGIEVREKQISNQTNSPSDPQGQKGGNK